MEIPYTYKGVGYGEASSVKKYAEEDSPLEDFAATDQTIVESLTEAEKDV